MNSTFIKQNTLAKIKHMHLRYKATQKICWCICKLYGKSGFNCMQYSGITRYSLRSKCVFFSCLNAIAP